MVYNEINGNEYVEVRGSATKTYTQLFRELHNLIDWGKITYKSYLLQTSNNNVFPLEITDGSSVISFVLSTTNMTNFYITRYVITSTSVSAIARTGNTPVDVSNNYTSGQGYRLYYR